MTQVFVDRMIDFLNEGDVEGAIQLLQENRKITENGLNDVISAIVPNLTSSVLEHKRVAFACSSNVLMFIAENYEPKITVLELQKYVKHASDHVTFFTVLDALQSCIMKIKNKDRVIDWCLDSFKIYIENLPLPEEVDDDLEVTNDGIIRTYVAIIEFLKPLVQETIDINCKQNGSVLGDYLLSFFIFLCGKPFCCLNKYIGKIQMYKEVADNLVTQAFCLTGDILYFLNIVSQRERQSACVKAQRKTYTHSSISNDWTHNISNIAYANFYFYVITKENYWIKVPQVYNSYYILETCAYFFKILLSEDYSISNGLIFMENVIKRISLNSVRSEVLGLDIYTALLEPIIKVMIYSNNDKQRKKGIRVFQEYIEIFNMEARYTIILYLYDIVEHSGLLSFITGMFKSFIIQCLNSNPRNPQFLGRNMELLLKKVCNLPHGSSSDIVEISDEVITALNLLRFLFIRDKTNETGIWNMVDMLKNDYLNPLREGIDLCKAHWKVKTKDLETEKSLAKEQDYSELTKTNMEVTLTVGGEQLPAMPRSRKISICYQVLNGLDVMESILIRVNECINMNEKCFRRLWTSSALLGDQSENDNNKKPESQQSIHEENDEEYEKNIKIKILSASLKFVPGMGWSKQAISAGAESIGYPGVIHGLFPNGSAALVLYFYSMCNRELNQILEKEAIEASSSSSRKIPEQQVRDAVETRLRMVIPYKKTWPQAMAIMTLPPNVPTALANLLTLVDDICYYAGDRSVDINWYTRRMILATIYKATELYMLQDTSEDHKETWLFLERRIKDTLQIQMMLSNKTKSDETLKRVSETTAAVFITARNILGLNK